MKVADSSQPAVQAGRSVPKLRLGGSQAWAVAPHDPTSERRRSSMALRRRVSCWQQAAALWNWSVWLAVGTLVVSQFLGAFWDSSTSEMPANYGQSPFKGLGPIAGLNDEPFSDRSIVCALQGRSYLPLTVNDALSLGTTKLVDTTGSSVSGFRVVKRATSVMTAGAKDKYTHTCATVALTMDAILRRCTLLGYNVTSDKLRIVDGIESTNTFAIENSLPILMIPYWDNCYTARFVVPGWDGSACVLRLVGEYTDETSTSPNAVVVTRAGREAKTIAWLNRPGGAWRNGWYEDLEGTKWHSDLTSDEKDAKTGIDVSLTQFNMRTDEKTVCNDAKKCASVFFEHWGAKFTSTTLVTTQTAVIVSNGKRFGFYQLRARLLNTIQSVYDWETLLSNVVALQILYRWMVAMVTLHRGYRLGISEWRNAGIGCLANSYSFRFLPLLLLPRLKMTLFAFWSTGCVFEGAQRALAEAWFVTYPAIVEVVLLYYSLLNLLGKLCRVRVSDALFGPTIVLFCALHRSREAIANSGWFVIAGRVATLIPVAAFDKISLLDFFTSSLALRTNGNETSIFVAKLCVFGASLLPFAWGLRERYYQTNTEAVSRIEGVLAIRFRCTGGLGSPHACLMTTNRRKRRQSDPGPTVVESVGQALDSYELVRLGYIVFGDDGAGGGSDIQTSKKKRSYVVSIDDWDLLTLLASARKFAHLWNHRVKVFPLDVNEPAAIANEPEMYHLDDARLQQIKWWEASSRSIE